MHTGKCPFCKKVLASAKIEYIPINEGITPKYHGVAYVCPHCSSVLGVGVDPASLKEDLVRAISAGAKAK